MIEAPTRIEPCGVEEMIPEPEADGHRYLKIPLNRFEPRGDA